MALPERFVISYIDNVLNFMFFLHLTFKVMIRRIHYLVLLAVGGLILHADTTLAQFPRIVIVEEFSSVTCKPCTTATAVLNDLVDEMGNRLVTIRNHVNWPPVPNPYSTSESEARKPYYEVSSLPQGRLDGQSVKVTDKNETFTRAEDRLAVDAPLKIDVTQTRAESDFNVEIKVTSSAEWSGEGSYVLQVVAVQRRIHDETILELPGNNGETILHDVMRKMITGTEGAELTIGSDASTTLNYVYQLGSGWGADEMYVVAFVQDDNTKEIIQGGFSARPTSGVDGLAAFPGYALGHCAPNPAYESVTIDYSVGGIEEVSLEIHNARGELLERVDDGVVEPGAHTIRLDVNDLPSGVYSYTLRAGTFTASHQMTVVR